MKTNLLTQLIERLRKLSSLELRDQTDLVARKEHDYTVQLIAHLAEVSRRSLHNQLGYSSLHDYCVECLGLTAGCVWLRVQVSNASLRYPLVLEALAERRISLSTAGKLVRHLTEENCERLVADCDGLTTRDVDKYLVQFAPKDVVSSGARKRGSAEACQPDLYNFRFAGNEEFLKKLERAALVSGIGDALGNMLELIDRSLDEFLAKYDPEMRQARREKRAARKASADAEKASGADTGNPSRDDTGHLSRADTGKASRRIPAEVRDLMFIRAEHRCEFRSADGILGPVRRCSERTHVDVDHIVPWGLGGSNEPDNLRVLCSSHNLFYAKQCFSPEFMIQMIESAREESPRAHEAHRSDHAKPRGGLA